MGHKKKGKYGIKIRPEIHYDTTFRKKKGLSTGKKILFALTLIVVVVVASSFIFSSSKLTPSGPSTSSTTDTKSYPQNVAPVFYSSPTVSSGSKLVLPISYVKENKLVFVDLKLQTPKQTLPYQGRTVPLSSYRNGDYLPLVVISTPSGNTVAGIRTCEPCNSFSFHIVKGNNLKCDVCGAEWTLENFAPASGGCATYPPPKVTSTVNGDNVEIDLSALQVQLSN